MPVQYSIQAIEGRRGPGRTKKARGALERMDEAGPSRPPTLAELSETLTESQFEAVVSERHYTATQIERENAMPRRFESWRG